MFLSRLGFALSPLLVVLLGAVLVWWRLANPIDLEARVPGLDRPTDTAELATDPGTGSLKKFDGKPADLPGEWPCFRGPKLDGICHDPTPRLENWPKDGPPVLWSVKLGEGHAGPAVRAGRVFVLDYDRDESCDALRCLSLGDGREIWRFSYPVKIKRNHGMSRTVPAVSDKYVVALGPKCHVTCLDPATGECKWVLDLVRQFQARVPEWYAGQCPLIDGDHVILAPGGPDALVMAVSAATGEVIWKTPNPRGWTMTHVSLVPMEIAGKRTYVYCGKGGVAGVSADDGKLLWETTDWKIAIATVPSPVVLPGNRIFFSGGYNAGSLLLQLDTQGDRIVPKTVRAIKSSQFGAVQHTPIVFENHIYGIREKDKTLVCLDFEGRVVWSSGSEHRFGLGPFLIADSKIYILDDEGVLTLAEASPRAYRQLAQAKVLEGPDAWGCMALVGDRLLARDSERMVCLDLKKK